MYRKSGSRVGVHAALDKPTAMIQPGSEEDVRLDDLYDTVQQCPCEGETYLAQSLRQDSWCVRRKDIGVGEFDSPEMYGGDERRDWTIEIPRW